MGCGAALADSLVFCLIVWWGNARRRNADFLVNFVDKQTLRRYNVSCETINDCLMLLGEAEI